MSPLQFTVSPVGPQQQFHSHTLSFIFLLTCSAGTGTGRGSAGIVIITSRLLVSNWFDGRDLIVILGFNPSPTNGSTGSKEQSLEVRFTIKCPDFVTVDFVARHGIVEFSFCQVLCSF